MNKEIVEDHVKEVMELVEFYNGSTKWGTTNEQLKAHAAIESKLRELLQDKCCSGGPQWGHSWDCHTLP